MSNLKNVQPLADFNWDEFESGSKAGNGEGELTKAYDETLNKIQEHQVVEGTVISIDKKEVVVNIGYKSDGIIPASEFRYNPDLKVGDKIDYEGTELEIQNNSVQGYDESTNNEKSGIIVLPERVVFTKDNIANYDF